MKTISPTEITIYQADINIFNPEINESLFSFFETLLTLTNQLTTTQEFSV